MGELKSFSASGEGKELLLATLDGIKDLIPNFDEINCFFIDRHGKLVFCHSESEDMSERGYKEYPFNVTTSMMAEHILSVVDNITDKELEELGEAPTGDEEDYTYGWRIFIPEGTSTSSGDDKEYNRNRISNYDWYYTVLAAYPILIEYGK